MASGSHDNPHPTKDDALQIDRQKRLEALTTHGDLNATQRRALRRIRWTKSSIPKPPSIVAHVLGSGIAVNSTTTSSPPPTVGAELLPRKVLA